MIDSTSERRVAMQVISTAIESELLLLSLVGRARRRIRPLWKTAEELNSDSCSFQRHSAKDSWKKGETDFLHVDICIR